MSLSAIDTALERMCADKSVAGITAIAGTGSEIIYDKAFGKRSLAGDTPMTTDSVFWIASMTKAVTGAAAMQLVEQGKLSLDDPIGKWLPDFANPQVLEGFDDQGAPKLRPAKKPLTLRNLLTHTSGYCYDMWNGDMVAYLKSQGVTRAATGQKKSLGGPVMTEPGTRWEYSIGIDIAGLAVEAASGQSLGDYFRDHLFKPLGMPDTGFRISDAMRTRLVGMHMRAADGSLDAYPFETSQNPVIEMGGGGLYSTTRDYLRFTQMILNRGTANGHRILKPETVADMARNHIGDLDVTRMIATGKMSNDVEFFPGVQKKWGLSFLINMTDTPEGRSAGSLAWAGLGNTYYWIDLTRNISGVIMMQLFPFADHKALEAFSTFERGIYDSLRNKTAA